jgi:methylated-DNA-[protein]-cysteine S-methyltransferase
MICRFKADMRDAGLFEMETGYYKSPLGLLKIEHEGGAVVSCVFDDAGDLPAENSLPDFLKKWLDGFFAGKDPGRAPKLAPQGLSDFTGAVLARVLKIPYGEKMTYGEIAGEMKTSPRAVGAAVGSNPIAVFIPCHRVWGEGGKPTGYAWGVTRKIALCSIESGSTGDEAR